MNNEDFTIIKRFFFGGLFFYEERFAEVFFVTRFGLASGIAFLLEILIDSNSVLYAIR